MDIKFQWVMEHMGFAYILTIIDCFTRKVLQWQVAYSIRKDSIIAAWEQVIVQYLQPHDMLQKQISIEVRNDNDGRFAAHAVQEFMRDNKLQQVFTHPYTPQENGHIESFHAILGKSLDRKPFATLAELEEHLAHFYNTYNKIRLHGSLDHLPPDRFWCLWKQNMIKTTFHNVKPTKHRLIIPHYQLSGNASQRAASGMPEGQINQTQVMVV
jgi:transposase InsO family protein